MLGDIVSRLTNPATAEHVAIVVAGPDILARIRDAVAAAGIPVGRMVADKVCHVVDHGGADIWLNLLGVMANAPQPGAAAIERMLAYAFPALVRIQRRSA